MLACVKRVNHINRQQKTATQKKTNSTMRAVCRRVLLVLG
jgi:hypothetical protein